MRKLSPQDLFRKECVFVGGALDPDVLPLPDLPEVAFVGRSNVGKSSLINALVGRRQLARVSNTPGRTQQINFFNLGNVLLLVDLPGYGYAKVSHKLAFDWQQHMTHYALERRNLACTFVLIDARHGLKDLDKQFFDLMHQRRNPFQLVFTKTDKVKAMDLQAHIDEAASFIQNFTTCFPDILLTSSAKKIGIDQLQRRIFDFTRK